MLIFRKRLGVVTYFCFIFKGKNKIPKKKTLSVTPEGKTGLWKTKFGSGGRVTYWEGTMMSRNTPLSLYTYGLY